MNKMIRCGIAIASLASTSLYGALDNVALNKPVTLNGTFEGANGATVVDGAFLARTTQWQTDTVYWYDKDRNSLIIDLQGAYVLNAFVVQADDNDSYRLEYMNPGGAWNVAWEVPNYDQYGNDEMWGMTTRPNPYDDTQVYNLASPITASALRFTATGGDDMYSVSEIQAFGTPVPEPSTYLAGLSAIGMLGWFWKSRKS